jgi:hypothetical protein
MAKKVHLSPGTYVGEKDLTFTVEALGVTTLGLVGETLKGPAFQPLFLRNYDDFKTLFGGTSPEKFRDSQIPKYELPYIAKSYLTQSNQLYVTRVLGLSGFDKGVAYVLKTTNDELVATLRSRGQYISDNLVFDVTAVGISGVTGSTISPLATFTITGSTSNGNFSYNVSLDKKKKNYVKSVFGTQAFDKETPLYVEEVFDTFLQKGAQLGTITGIDSTLTVVNKWNHYQFQYQSPVSPFFVSELRGGQVQRLFRAVSISDGATANTEVKLSVANIDLNKKTFDVLVRAFNDSDKNPVVLERYLSCSMDEKADNYIGKKIGTVDNKYDLRSSYVILEMADKAPADAVPAGFEGYEFRSVAGSVTVPSVHYKTKYYKPGEVVATPVVGSPIISTGDKVRKAYLGFSDLEYGYDADLLSFKGKDYVGTAAWNNGLDHATSTNGFHMDVNAPAGFTPGAGTFTDAATLEASTTHPYHDIKTRKFTAMLAGGFDGWDEFRETRTNTDDFKIGRTKFTANGFDLFTSVEYDETFGTSDYYAFLYGAKTFQNPEATIINILATPGIDMLNNTELVRDVIEIVEERRRDAIYLPTLPDMKMIGNTSPANTDEWLFPKDIIDELEATEIDSNYTAVYYPWIQVSDVENNANLFIPPTAEVVRNMAYTDNIAHPWYATAGYSRGVVNTRKARLAVDQDDRDVLYEGRINPLMTQTDVGVVIWGNRNLQIKDSALNRLNIRRLLLQAKSLIVKVANRLLFDPNDARVRNEFLSQVNPILDNIRKERGLTDFRVVLSPENAEDVDRNTLQGKIFIKPTPTLEFIELEFNVAPNSVSFDNI